VVALCYEVRESGGEPRAHPPSGSLQPPP
jgi:hypothetical protein